LPFIELLEPESLLYSLGSDLKEKRPLPNTGRLLLLQELYATGSLPRICLRGNVFMEPLPSNGSIRHIIIIIIINFMEDNCLWEANGRWAVQEIRRILWNSRIYFHNHFDELYASKS
jgi:hypothetical protein